jgi:hypothetical protein
MRLVIYLLLIFHCVTTQASTPVVRFEHLTIEDGLSQNSVLAILQDHQGFFGLPPVMASIAMMATISNTFTATTKTVILSQEISSMAFMKIIKDAFG